MDPTVETLAARKREMHVAIRSAIGNSIGLQVILIAVSVSLRNYPDMGLIPLAALAVYWPAVIGRALQLRDSTKVTMLDLHLLRWGYFWIFCLVVLIYRVYLALRLPAY